MVEDDPAVSSVLSFALQRHGYQVLRAQNGPQAIGLLSRYPGNLDLAVCDVLLQNESGALVAAQVRELRPRTRVLFLSGFPLSILVERRLLYCETFQDGETFFLQKPFMPQELLRVIELATKPGYCGDASGRPA